MRRTSIMTMRQLITYSFMLSASGVTFCYQYPQIVAPMLITGCIGCLLVAVGLITLPIK